MSVDKREQEPSGRIRDEVTDIDYEKTFSFFQQRARKYNEENPYAVTMYQDHDSKLVQERNAKEVEVILPFLALDSESKVLDIACGIGRWYDAVEEEIREYCGLDFSEDLIGIAKMRHENRKNVDFLTGSVIEVEQLLAQNEKGKYNRVLMMGILMYLNDADIRNVMNQISHVVEPEAIVCIREPIAINQRLTLKDFYSEELENHYHAIYRTREELMNILGDTLIGNGFSIEREGWLFEENLNNRKETAQYYFVFRRGR